MDGEEKKTSGNSLSYQRDEHVILKSKLRYVARMHDAIELLEIVKLNFVRSDCRDHSSICLSCKRCLVCTVPHFCCCGKCGPDCNHDHAVLSTVCFQMQELSHDRNRVVEDRMKRRRQVWRLQQLKGKTMLKKLKLMWKILLGKKSVVMGRFWINQPSTSQPAHHMHGKNVLASVDCYESSFTTVYFVIALSKGWNLIKRKEYA